MPIINKTAVLNPFSDLTSNILDYVPRATTSEFGIVAIGSGINVDALGRIYLDTQEYSDRLTAIEAQASSSLATQQTEVAAAIAQVNLAQSQTITALTLEVSNLKADLTNSITATQTDLINRADELAQDVTDITVQLTQDKAAFTQEIQDAIDTLQDEASVASALRTPRKIQGVDFDGTQDISLPIFSTQIDGLVPKRVGATSTKYLCEDGTWVIPTNTTYALLTKAVAEVGTATTANTISAQVLKDAIKYHAPPVTNITGNAGTATKLATAPTITLSGAATGTATSFDGSANISIEVTSLDAAKLSGTASIPTTGNAGTATKLQTPRTINGVLFDGTQNISLPEAVAYSLPTASASVLGGIKVGSGLAISNSVLSVGTLNQSTTGNAATASKLQTARTISLTGNVTGSASFDGSANASITTAITGLGVANGIATLDSSGQVPSTQLPSYVDDVLEYLNVAAFPATGVAGKIYVETTGNTTYRWGGTAYVKITSGEVSSVAGKIGVVNLSKADVGLGNVDNTADSSKSVASASKLTTALTIGGVSFDGTTNINLPGVNTAGNQNTSGNAATTTKLQTARTIAISGAVTGTATSFDGSANITIATTAIDGSNISTGTIPAARIPTLNQSTSGNAATATKLLNPVKINGIDFDGTADINLDVYNKSEVDTAIANATPTIPNATETVAGKAKIATTSIAQAGVNDTDFITANKLRGALNAEGSAPVFACRAWVNFNGTGTVAIRASGNVSSVTDSGVGLYTVNFTTAMQDVNYSAVANYNMANTAVTNDNSGNASCNNYLTTSVTLSVMNGSASTRDAACISVSITR